jgi:AraC-like DNA-binding protein
MMTAANVSQPFRVERFDHRLSQFDLNFENVVIHSCLRNFEKKVTDSGLSVKMAIKGEEEYLIDGLPYVLKPGKFLVVNKHQQFDVRIKSENWVEAVCFYLSEQVVEEVYTNLSRREVNNLDDPYELNTESLVFLEKLFTNTENELGAFIEQIKPYLLKNELTAVADPSQFFYTLAERLLRSQVKIDRQIDRIPSSKQSTKEELYRRLTIARAYIMDNYTTNIKLDELSKVAYLSKYHLLRTYKLVFGITPYQEVLRLRLQKATELLPDDQSLEEIALEVGFSDRRSFAKAFRKYFSCSPSEYRRTLFL